MTGEKPLVSIIIPVYNGANYLKQAIDSALNQTYENIEVLVVNDGSKDDGATEKIALEYGDKIRYIKKENGGVSSALNVGIRNMNGEYFSWLSHDDVYEKTKVEKQVELLESVNDDNVCAVCLCRQINNKSEFISNVITLNNIETNRVCSGREMLKYILTEQSLNGCALLVPKRVLDNTSLFDEGLRYNQDFKMWIDICLCGVKWVVSDDLGVLSRIHAQQVTQTRRDLMHKDSVTYGKEIIPKFAVISTREQNFLLYYAKIGAKHNISENVNYAKQLLKENKLYGLSQSIKLNGTVLYGKIRPFIRRTYYKLVKRVKTQ